METKPTAAPAVSPAAETPTIAGQHVDLDALRDSILATRSMVRDERVRAELWDCAAKAESARKKLAAAHRKLAKELAAK